NVDFRTVVFGCMMFFGFATLVTKIMHAEDTHNQHAKMMPRFHAQEMNLADALPLSASIQHTPASARQQARGS
ncbi:hypothetical protein CYMTET_19162, partial [Cymbomonas tetramitiformis]